MVRFGRGYIPFPQYKMATTRKVQVKCPKCGYVAEVHSGWTQFVCPRCSHGIYPEKREHSVPSWKKEAHDALARERKDYARRNQRK